MQGLLDSFERIGLMKGENWPGEVVKTRMNFQQIVFCTNDTPKKNGVLNW